MSSKKLKLSPRLTRLEQFAYMNEKKQSDTSPEVETILNSIPNVIASARGDLDSFDYRVQTIDEESGQVVSMWHGIDLYPNSTSKDHKIVNMIANRFITQSSFLRFHAARERSTK